MVINKDALVKILLPALILSSLFITIIPEIRQVGIIFFIIGSIAWFLVLIEKLKLLTQDDETDRMLKFFFYPLIILNIFLLIFSSDYRNGGAGWIYLILSILTLILYMTPQFKSIVIGIDKKITKGILIGVGVAIGFIIVSKIAPGFSLLTPELPFSLLNQVRFIVIVLFAPIFEATAWRGGLLPYLQKIYGLSFGISNFLQSLIFAIFHLLAYGVSASLYNNLIELYGATLIIGGSLIVAFVFALIMGFLVTKFQTLLVEYIPHAIINAFIFFSLSVGSFFSFG